MDLNIGDCGWKLINQGSDKCLKIGINEDICIVGIIFKYFDNVLKFLTKDQALLYIEKYYNRNV
jgi:hypothetical protein